MPNGVRLAHLEAEADAGQDAVRLRDRKRHRPESGGRPLARDARHAAAVSGTLDAKARILAADGGEHLERRCAAEHHLGDAAHEGIARHLEDQRHHERRRQRDRRGTPAVRTSHESVEVRAQPGQLDGLADAGRAGCAHPPPLREGGGASDVRDRREVLVLAVDGRHHARQRARLEASRGLMLVGEERRVRRHRGLQLSKLCLHGGGGIAERPLECRRIHLVEHAHGIEHGLGAQVHAARPVACGTITGIVPAVLVHHVLTSLALFAAGMQTAPLRRGIRVADLIIRP
ncbi:MAG: hypothetical protein ACKOEL_10055 [Planctomycetota bacterium]